ncbi:Rrf2 family transcriptional regulator [Spiribacter aquaticus]|uniref:Rrf2 family transcriptional regulator n=1 Tax=Spiribacter aquaticus TaxID=1935996 RepID=A0A557RJ04_9GAMM|nr:MULTISPECIES: Rrf2 family transcriptional regulator [Spiribacter]KAF0280325.1 Rrf2 family transcriptional regulator [Spiribacter roseus]KAF0282046.1 Rrf2 family transcriptional regulator [Spiribacter roseus]TVO65138.1 Rrf2 family transcriptional regulator [Spiribacter aquaticus]
MIRLSAKSRYAVSALLHLAVHNQAGAVPLAEISVCQGISMSYIDQIFWKLRRAGLVRGTPGPGGGYRLGRSPESIAMGEVITLMDGQGGPRRATSALDERLWAGLAERIETFLNGITLADFAARPDVREALLDQYAGGSWRCDVCGALSTRQQPIGGSQA